MFRPYYSVLTYRHYPYEESSVYSREKSIIALSLVVIVIFEIEIEIVSYYVITLLVITVLNASPMHIQLEILIHIYVS
mgnify:CR=1 FL=1